MEKGNRLTSLFQNLEKLTSPEAALVPCFTSDDYQQLRYVTSRMFQYVSTQEKPNRDIILKNVDYLDRLLYVLEHSKDKVTTLNLIGILSEVSGRSSNKRLSVLVNRGATQILLHVLVCETKQTDCSEDLLIALHQLISKVGPKDRKFGVKARLYQVLGVSLNLLRSYNAQPRILLPIVQVLKLCSVDAVNSSYLGKNGAVLHLFKIFTFCQRKHLLLLKYSLETLSLLVKSKSNAARAVGQGGVTVLLGMFSDWHRVDTKNRHIGLRKAVLSVLKNITNLKSGQQALVEADGVRVLYVACQETVDCRELESLNYMASIIMRKCFPKTHLPLTSLKNPLVFHLPDDKCVENSEMTKTAEAEEVGYESSLDNDDDISSDDDREVRKACDSDDEAELGLPYNTSYKRSWDDLVMYKPFFSELYEYDAMTECDSTTNPVKNLPTPVLNSSLTKPVCQSSADLRRNCNSVMNILVDRSLPTESNQFVGEKRQQSHLANPNLGPSHPSVPESLCLESRRLSFSCSGKESLGNVWSVPMIHVGVASPKMPKRTMAFPRSPKARRKNLMKTSNGKLKEKKLEKSAKCKASSKSPLDDWFAFDLSMVMSTLTSSGIPSEESPQESKLDNAAIDDDDPTVMIDGEGGGQQKIEDPELYADLAATMNSVGVFNKLAYPELHGHCVPPFKESLCEKKLGIQRQMIFEDIDRFINPELVFDHVVYDLDAIVAVSAQQTKPNLTNDDETRVLGKENLSDALMFNSLFESGNLRKVVQVHQYEYDLILNPDVNTNRFHQWFYFEVSNMERSVPYRFNIINCEKMNSQFNFGMRPVMFSVAEAMQGRPYWSRTGTKVCYYKNHFVRSSQTTGGIRGKTYYTASFTVTFRHERDVCYIAYHYPYTYTLLQYHLKKWEKTLSTGNIYFRNQMLCETVGGNAVPLVTITSHPGSSDKDGGIFQFKNRPYVFLTARVHPGESNASWVMKGTIDFLLSDHPTAELLRQTYIFKIVPMLNPDGVINGNHRCSLVAEDLNRRWFCPCPKRHPTIYHTKGLLQYLTALDRAPYVFCDYHGHSRRKNVFLYGCSPNMSWVPEDLDNPGVLPSLTEDTGYKTLPRVLHNIAPAFSLNSCSFVVEKAKETTARVVVWRQMRVLRSYTMESTYCGCDQGVYRGKHINTDHLEMMGRKFVEALSKIKIKQSRTSITVPSSEVTDETIYQRISNEDNKISSVNLPNSSSSIGSSPSDVDGVDSDIDEELDEYDKHVCD